MSYLYKPTVTSYWNPDGHKCSKAEAILRDEQGNSVYRTVRRTMRRRGRKPRTVKARVPVCKPGYRRKSEKSKHYHGVYRDRDGLEHRTTLFTDRTASRTRLNELENSAEDPFASHAERRLSGHLEDFKQALVSRKKSDEYVALKIARIRRVIDGCGCVWLTDLDSEVIQQFIGELKDKNDLSHRTATWYVQALRHFSRSNPARSAQRPRRMERRGRSATPSPLPVRG